MTSDAEKKPLSPAPSPEEGFLALRERLARIVVATEETLRLSPERARAVLEERARALASASATTLPTGKVVEVVLFSLGDERYAIEAHHVREVVRPGDCTPVPAAPDFLAGVINLRGEILAVFDLRPFFGIAVHQPTPASRILVLGDERVEFGLLVDAAHAVQTLPLDYILESPSTITAAREYLRGVTGDAVIVLDGKALLRDRRLFIDTGENVSA